MTRTSVELTAPASQSRNRRLGIGDEFPALRKNRLNREGAVVLLAGQGTRWKSDEGEGEERWEIGREGAYAGLGLSSPRGLSNRVSLLSLAVS